MMQGEIWVKSSLDGTDQPSLLFRAEGNEPRPLIVGLHTWSHDRSNQIRYLLSFAEEQNFHLLLPEFRGPNLIGNPNGAFACGSLHAKQDVKDALDFVCDTENVDTQNIFLIGLSGGAHMALLMAGFCPELFRAVAAFAPISDLSRWKGEAPTYAPHIEYCCGKDEEELFDRSPIKYIDTIAQANVKIFHGKIDEIVPFAQSLDFFCEMQKRHPKARLYLDIFNGGHQFDLGLCQHWILSQYRPPQNSNITG